MLENSFFRQHGVCKYSCSQKVIGKQDPYRWKNCFRSIKVRGPLDKCKKSCFLFWVWSFNVSHDCFIILEHSSNVYLVLFRYKWHYFKPIVISQQEMSSLEVFTKLLILLDTKPTNLQRLCYHACTPLSRQFTFDFKEVNNSM